MKRITKNIIICSAFFSFLFAGTAIFAAEKTDAEVKAELQSLYERAEELAKKVEEMTGTTVAEVSEVETGDLYLSEYIKYGANNNPVEVKKLQTFLNDNMGKNIPVTGFYGEITMAAVKEFQVKYKEGILTPWGITEPTGYVYKTTQRQINMLVNPELNLPMPNLYGEKVIATAVSSEANTTNEVLGGVEKEQVEEAQTETKTKIFNDEAQTVGIGDNEEEAEENGEENGEEKESRAGTWTILVIALFGLGTALYYIYTEKPAGKQQM
jgi:hypothetical protein